METLALDMASFSSEIFFFFSNVSGVTSFYEAFKRCMLFPGVTFVCFEFSLKCTCFFSKGSMHPGVYSSLGKQ